MDSARYIVPTPLLNISTNASFVDTSPSIGIFSEILIIGQKNKINNVKDTNKISQSKNKFFLSFFIIFSPYVTLISNIPPPLHKKSSIFHYQILIFSSFFPLRPLAFLYNSYPSNIHKFKDNFLFPTLQCVFPIKGDDFSESILWKIQVSDFFI